MEKRYQVFISSTYADLQEERQEVMQALLELDCIRTAGMELFPAANEDQWTLIKRVIDDCDYYMVIVAGRYGTVGPDGMSYTEMEYRYALEQEKPVIGFLHKDPGSLPVDRSEDTEAGRQKLDEFCELVKKKMCRFWDSPADLGSQVSRSLVKLMKTTPATGWVRGDLVPDESAANEILRLRKKIEELEKGLEEARFEAPEEARHLAQGSDTFIINFSFSALPPGSISRATYAHKIEVTWDEIFAAIAPPMIDEVSDRNFREELSTLAKDTALEELQNMDRFERYTLSNFNVNDEDFQTIKIQLRTLGLLVKSDRSRSVKDTATYWTLTPYGDTVMTRLRAIPRNEEIE